MTTAADLGKESIVQQFHDYSVDIDVLDGNKWSAIHAAARRGKVSLCSVIIRKFQSTRLPFRLIARLEIDSYERQSPKRKAHSRWVSTLMQIIVLTFGVNRP